MNSIECVHLGKIECHKCGQHLHDNNYSYDESENQAGISHCSQCGKITEHPCDDAIQATKGEWGI